jgi:hypothetical protein
MHLYYALFSRLGSAVAVLIMFFVNAYAQQAVDQVTGINELNLGEEYSSIQSSLYLITGKEPVYRQNPWLAESFLRNVNRGIQEAIYEGNTLHVVNGRKASEMRVLFYNNKLYKIRWTFYAGDFSNLPLIFSEFMDYYVKRFGAPSQTILGDTLIWEGKTNRLQVFIDKESIQVEFRDQKTETILKAQE